MVQDRFRKIAVVILILIVGLGVFGRFYRITENQFVYYDEGLYLNHNVNFLYYLKSHPPDSFGKFFKYIEICLHMALADGKFLWFFLSSLRGFIVGFDGWFFTRLLSAVFGSLTLVAIYFFARRYYGSHKTALLSMALLAIFPSHLYYSRLGMQEALSTLCFTLGFYFYLFPRRLHFKTFLSGFLFACVFFTNYRMIIIPVIMGLTELGYSWAIKERPNFRKYLWNLLTFLSIIFLVGNIDDGANTKITFAWMFQQAHLAKGEFSFFNLLSYPYYLFRLESITFGILFFGNIIYAFEKKWKKLFPFALVCVMMIIFSLAQEKGVRYLCVVMPLMVSAVASVIMDLVDSEKQFIRRRVYIFCIVVLMGHFLFKGYAITQFNSDYETAMNDIQRMDPDAKILCSQPLILNLYANNRKNVKTIPHYVPHQDNYLLLLYAHGYRYLILDPQAYVSYTENGKRFHTTLEGYLDPVISYVTPVRTYPHFSRALLERFVLEHNVDLRTSLKFLRFSQKDQYNALRIYDLKDCVFVIHKQLELHKHLNNLQSAIF